MSQPPGPTYESEMPRSWGLFTSRVDANQPTDEEKAAAEELIRTGWFDRYASTYDRNKAREDFQNGMRYGFKDRTYKVNWDVWRSEYKDRNYPPGSFDPRPESPQRPEDIPVAPDPNKPNWMTDEQWERELRRQQERDRRELERQFKENKGRGIGEPMRKEDHPFYNPNPEPSPWAREPDKPRWWRRGETPAQRWLRQEKRKDYYKRQREQNRGQGEDESE